MSDTPGRVKLQLIKRPRRVEVEEGELTDPISQGMLFPVPKRDLLIFLVVPRLTEEEFTKTLDLSKPTVILELRRSPRFDIGRMNRQEAFKRFAAFDSQYYDLSSDQVKRVDPVALTQSFLERSTKPLAGPVLLLLNESPSEHEPSQESVTWRIARLFASKSKHSWETLEIPQFT
jgi:hypothetical protein